MINIMKLFILFKFFYKSIIYYFYSKKKEILIRRKIKSIGQDLENKISTMLYIGDYEDAMVILDAIESVDELNYIQYRLSDLIKKQKYNYIIEKRIITPEKAGYSNMKKFLVADFSVKIKKMVVNDKINKPYDYEDKEIDDMLLIADAETQRLKKNKIRESGYFWDNHKKERINLLEEITNESLNWYFRKIPSYIEYNTNIPYDNEFDKPNIEIITQPIISHYLGYFIKSLQKKNVLLYKSTKNGCLVIRINTEGTHVYKPFHQTDIDLSINDYKFIFDILGDNMMKCQSYKYELSECGFRLHQLINSHTIPVR